LLDYDFYQEMHNKIKEDWKNFDEHKLHLILQEKESHKSSTNFVYSIYYI